MKYEEIQLTYTEDSTPFGSSGQAAYVFNDVATEYLKDFYDEVDIYHGEGWMAKLVRDELDNVESDEEYKTTRSDSFILCMNALLEAETARKENFTVNTEYEHVIWLFHDLHHIQFDACAEVINVTDIAEQRAIQGSIDMCITNNIPLPWKIIANTELEFHQRFDTELLLWIPEHNYYEGDELNLTIK